MIGKQLILIICIMGSLHILPLINLTHIQINIPRIPQICKMLCKHSLMPAHNLIKGLKHRKVFPVFIKITTGRHAFSDSPEIHLDVLRPVSIRTCSHWIDRLGMCGQSPEITAAAVHFLKHLGQWIDRPKKGIVKQNNLIVCRRLIF